jgi:hypothetical protein
MKWLLLIMILVSGFTPAPVENVRVMAVCKESKISILGSSNVNTFSLDISQYSGRDTLVMVQRTNQPITMFRRGLLRLPVNDFKTANPILNKDFKKIVKAKYYPEIRMNFKSLNIFPCTQAQNVPAVAEMEISLAGITKTFKINVLSCRTGEVVNLRGNTQVNFSDFGLVAPENILGFIDVNDQLKVNFHLTLKDLTQGYAMK